MAYERVKDGRKRGPYGPYSPQETRQKLLDVALELFGDHGFQATSVQMVAQRAGVTKGAFYHHFESKDDLLQADPCRVRVATPRGGTGDRRRRQWTARATSRRHRGVIFTFAKYRSHVTIFYQEFRSLGGTAYASVRKMHDDESSIVLDIIERGQAAGELNSDVNPKLLVVRDIGNHCLDLPVVRPSGAARPGDHRRRPGRHHPRVVRCHGQRSRRSPRGPEPGPVAPPSADARHGELVERSPVALQQHRSTRAEAFPWHRSAACDVRCAVSRDVALPHVRTRRSA